VTYTILILVSCIVLAVISAASMIQKKINRTNVFILNFFYLSCEFSYLTNVDGLYLFQRKLEPLWKLYLKELDITSYLEPCEITLLSSVVSLDKKDFSRFTPEYTNLIMRKAIQIASESRSCL